MTFGYRPLEPLTLHRMRCDLCGLVLSNVDPMAMQAAEAEHRVMCPLRSGDQ